ncbi:DUF6263 family protein [uncultured Sunxiuqinia sp.]|uniref:DUF6263 family protein n=1 Tax=uncultured Sunxiuqinia sp. TaxID=1573825 RepID=UPI002AA6851C|nr:DUF6263 family protein [uncultured Sunxiuqinia sp.]
MKTSKATLLLIIVSLFCSFSTQAKTKKLLRLNLEKGAVYEMNMNMDNHMDQEMMGQQIKMDQKMQMVTSMTVTDVLPNKNFMLTYQYKSIRMDMETMGQTMSFNTDKPADDNPASNMLKGMTKVELKMEITSRGEVVNIEGFESFSNVFGANPQLEGMLQMFSDKEAFKSNFSKTFNYFPEDKVSVGDTWNSTQQLKDFMNMNIDMHFKVTNIEDDKITLDVNSDFSSNSPMEQGGMKMEMNMTGKQNGEMKINSEDGMVSSSDLSQDISMLMKMTNPQTQEEQEIPMEMKSTVRVTVDKK